jgi:hypothetical protein
MPALDVRISRYKSRTWFSKRQGMKSSLESLRWKQLIRSEGRRRTIHIDISSASRHYEIRYVKRESPSVCSAGGKWYVLVSGFFAAGSKFISIVLPVWVLTRVLSPPCLESLPWRCRSWPSHCQWCWILLCFRGDNPAVKGCPYPGPRQ